MNVEDVKKLPTEEKIRIMEAIWDSFEQEGDEIDSPDWHGDVLRRRRARIESGEATFLSLEEARERLGG